MERLGLSVLVLVVLLLAGATYARNTVWMSKISLWEDVVRKSPYKARARNNLGAFYIDEGYPDKGEREIQAALKISPGYPDAHFNLGTIYYESGRLNEAIMEFQTAVKLKPDYADAHNYLGAIYERLGRVEDAIKEYQTSLQIDPDNGPARKNLERQSKITTDKR
jgi:Tfp pilus assembly protein PilF